MHVTRSLAEGYLEAYAADPASKAQVASVRRQLANKKNVAIEVPEAWAAKGASAVQVNARARPATGFDAAPTRALGQDWGRDS